VGVGVGIGAGVGVGVGVLLNKKEMVKMGKTITVSDETFELIKDQLKEGEQIDVAELDDLIGKKFFFRTVTYHLTGKVEKRIGKFLELSKAAWIADSGRFMDAIKSGKLNEVEPVGQAWVNLESVTDFFPWNHKLPKDQK